MNSVNEQKDSEGAMDESVDFGQPTDEKVEDPEPVKIVIEEHNDTVADVDSQHVEEVNNENKTAASHQNNTSQDEKMQVESTPDNRQEEAEDEEEELKKLVSHSYEAIDKIKADVDGYRKAVEAFKGEKDSKEFRYLDEMLTRCQLSLDNVQTHGDIELRKSRKQAVNDIETILKTLESKVSFS